MNEVYATAIRFLKTATVADKSNNTEAAIRAYKEARMRAAAALRGGSDPAKAEACRQLIERVDKRLQELESYHSSSLPQEKPTHPRPTQKMPMKPAPKPSMKPEPKPSIKPAPKPSMKPEPKPSLKPEPKPSIKPEPKPSIKPQGPARAPLAPRPAPRPPPSEFMQKMETAILTERPNISFADVAGLTAAKQLLNEAVIMPLRIPEMYTGPTRPWAGILLYGPPGTGKSFLAKAVAGEAQDVHFLTVSNADLTSKWLGESEKLVKALFDTARQMKPAVIFIDEIDALVSQRGEHDSDSAKRIKTEFLTQMDGVNSHNDGVLVMAATNLPWDLDQAMLRRFERRIYIPLPDQRARYALITNQLKEASHDLTTEQVGRIVMHTEGYSGADLATLIRDALMQPLREFQASTEFVQMRAMDLNGVERDGLWVSAAGMNLPTARRCRWDELPKADLARPMTHFCHFVKSLQRVKPSVDHRFMNRYQEWTRQMGESGV